MGASGPPFDVVRAGLGEVDGLGDVYRATDANLATASRAQGDEPVSYPLVKTRVGDGRPGDGSRGRPPMSTNVQEPLWRNTMGDGCEFRFEWL